MKRSSANSQTIFPIGLLLLIAAVLIGTFIWFSRITPGSSDEEGSASTFTSEIQRPSSSHPKPPAIDPTNTPAAEDARFHLAARDGASPLEQARTAAANARADRAQARSELASAEAALVDLEGEIEDLESFIEGLENAGEDPADHAFEGMKLFNPVLDRYQAEMDRIVVAEEAEENATNRLRLAEESIDALEN